MLRGEESHIFFFEKPVKSVLYAYKLLNLLKKLQYNDKINAREYFYKLGA